MEESIGSMFHDLLPLPTAAIGYECLRQLTALNPHRFILQSTSGSFRLDQFIEAGHCHVKLNPEILNQFQTDFVKSEGLFQDPANVWYRVEWKNHPLDVVTLSWSTNGCENVQYTIVADTREIAEGFFWEVCEWASEVRGEVLVFQEGYWHKSRSLYQAIRNSSFDNLILPPRLKQEIQDDFTQFFASRDIYTRHGVPWKRGVLLIGPPGNGKSHTVKALTNWLNVPCLYVKSFLSEYRNDQRNIRAVFERARENTPCMLVLEDLDSLITDKNRSFFLNELDGFAANTGVVVLATTNHPERLDTAILNRPSRFDRKYYFELPAPEERISYIESWNRELETELRLSAAGIERTGGATEGFSFAYLKELFLSSMMRWIARPGMESMEAIMSDQCNILREQMAHIVEESPNDVTMDDDEE